MEEGDSLGPWLFPNRMCHLSAHGIARQPKWWFLGVLIHFWLFSLEAALPHLHFRFPQKLSEECEMRRRRLCYNFPWFDVSASIDVCIPSFAEWRRGLGRWGGFVDGRLCCELDHACETPGFQAKLCFTGDRLWHLEIQVKLNLIRGFHSLSVGCVAYSRSWKTTGFLWPDYLNLIYWEIWEARAPEALQKTEKMFTPHSNRSACTMSRASGVCNQLG